EDGTAVAHVRFLCEHFEERKKAYGVDEMQAFTLLLQLALVILRSMERDGYTVWHLERGDLAAFDFWAGRDFEPEFGLPSAYSEAKREAFYRANAGRTLLP